MSGKRSRKGRKKQNHTVRDGSLARKHDSAPAPSLTPTSGSRLVAAAPSVVTPALATGRSEASEPSAVEVVGAVVHALEAALLDDSPVAGEQKAEPKGAQVGADAHADASQDGHAAREGGARPTISSHAGDAAVETRLRAGSLPRSSRDASATIHDEIDAGPVTPRVWEHRSHPRVAIAVDIDLASESHFFSGLSGDVSEGGVFVQTYRHIAVGSDVAVEFALPGGQVSAHGKVRWHRENSDSSPPGVGISFDELSEGDRALIHRFCEARAPLYYDDVERG